MIEEYWKKLKEELNKLKIYQYNIIKDMEYKGIKQIEYLFNKINDEDYYKPIKTKDAYIEYWWLYRIWKQKR